jgi:outer membrane protein assembly factor BamD
MKFLRLHFYITLLILFVALSGCKSKKDDELAVVPITQLYNSGSELLAKHKYIKAADEFGKIFFQHPGNPVTPQAELMQAYSLYMASNYGEAVDVIDGFIVLHPLNVDIAYAYYLKALCYYMEISNVDLDQSRTEYAKDSLNEVITRFPGSKYALDAQLKIDLVNEHLAGKEMEIGRYYLRMKNPIAAIKRFQEVVSNYQTTSHISESLYRLVYCYVQLGLIDEAKKYGAVLGNNYPESRWYKFSYDLVNKHT